MFSVDCVAVASRHSEVAKRAILAAKSPSHKLLTDVRDVRFRGEFAIISTMARHIAE